MPGRQRLVYEMPKMQPERGHSPHIFHRRGQNATSRFVRALCRDQWRDGPEGDFVGFADKGIGGLNREFTEIAFKRPGERRGTSTSRGMSHIPTNRGKADRQEQWVRITQSSNRAQRQRAVLYALAQQCRAAQSVEAK